MYEKLVLPSQIYELKNRLLTVYSVLQVCFAGNKKTPQTRSLVDVRETFVILPLLGTRTKTAQEDIIRKNKC